MEKIYFNCFIIWTLFTTSTGQQRGIRCLNCDDVSSPEHCQDITVCGQGEICSTREFTDQIGVRGYRLGCEDHITCELIQQAHTVFGKRDGKAANQTSPLKCNTCCSTDICNKHLCQESAGGHPTTTKPTTTTKGMTCMRCEDVDSPQHCRQTTICGSNEICFTREYTDYKGQRGYRLGCESKRRCDVFFSAKTLFGKRHLKDRALPEECYDCCSSDECNTGLCEGRSGGLTTTQSTTTTTVGTVYYQSTTLVSGYNERCVRFEDACYLISFKERNYTESRKYCLSQGADVVSLHSSSENNFIARQLTSAGKYVVSFWTSGVYSHTDGKWSWQDGTPFDYTNWFAGNPLKEYSGKRDYHIMIENPKHASQYRSAPMWVYDGTVEYGVICKMYYK